MFRKVISETSIRWRDEAECIGEDPEMFFPEGKSNYALNQEALAKSICRQCRVLEQCLVWSLETKQLYGIWGGLNEDERKALLKVRSAS